LCKNILTLKIYWEKERSPMQLQEKQAWFVVGLIAFCLCLYIPLGILRGFAHGAGVFGLMGLIGFLPIWALVERRRGKIIFDERDNAIARTAGIVGYSIFWLAFVGAGMIPWVVLGDDALIPVRILPVAVLFAWIVLQSARAIVTLILYRRDRADDGGEHG
jgi:hypothetical protein